MRKHRSKASSLTGALGLLLSVGASANAWALQNAEPAKEAAPVVAAPAPVPPPPPPPVVVAPAPAPAPLPAAVPAPAPVAPVMADTSPKPATEDLSVPDPDSISQVGIQRLPGYAYPEPMTRGLKHGSLWLTFHGMQWPYMPAKGQESRFVLGVSGWGWVDTAYQKFGPWGSNSNIEQSRVKYWKQQARLVVRVTPTYTFSDGFFLQGQAELVATEDQTISRSDVGGADTDDLWLRLGKWNKWDLQIGRFEGWEVFHLGMGLDQNTFERKGAVGIGESAYNIQFYGLTDNQFRPAGSAGNFAFHYYPLPFLRFELLGMAGSLSGPAYATRPVAVLDFGWLKLKFGTEYQKVVGQQAQDKTSVTSKGVGGALQFVFQPNLEFGLNAAQGTIWSIDSLGRQDLKGSLTRTSFGGFLNVSNGHPRHTLIFGLGSIFTRNVDQNNLLQNGVVDNYWHYQGFLAAQYVIHNQFYIKVVGGYSRGHWLTAGDDPPVQFNDEMYSARVRFSYYF